MSTRRIEILQPIAGLDFSWSPGDVVELPAEEAEKWADDVRAKWAPGGPETPESPRRETTTQPAPETPESPARRETTTAPRLAAPRKRTARKAAAKKAAPAAPAPPS